MSKVTFTLGLATLLIIAAACGSNSSENGKVINSARVGNLTVELSSRTGELKHGGDEFFVTFKDSSGKAIDVGAVALIFHMPAMGSMAVMNDQTTFTMTSTPGVYRGRANIEMAGEWQAQVSYEGPAGKGRLRFR